METRSVNKNYFQLIRREREGEGEHAYNIYIYMYTCLQCMVVDDQTRVFGMVLTQTYKGVHTIQFIYCFGDLFIYYYEL